MTDFHQSREWKALARKHKQLMLKSGKYYCVDCGVTENLESDHVLPVSRFWKYRLKSWNLVLRCEEDNKKKGARLIWAPSTGKVLLIVVCRKVIVYFCAGFIVWLTMTISVHHTLMQ